MASLTLSGGEKLEAKLAEIAKSIAKGGKLRVGFLEDATYADGTKVAAVAAIQNFGAPARGIPPRPFFNKFIENNSDGWGEKLANLLARNDFDVEKALNLMGMGMVGQLQESIIQTNAPPLSKVTLLLRERFPTGDYEPGDVWQAFSDIAAGIEPSGGSGKPLVWSGHMLQSVDYEVETDG